ncbi:hypothetical protein H0H92_012881 [Tricholoma furcatifolium]|nr:hypothetical protein H0H92_012881 [Tricholoma furcatifolium]
MDQDVDMDAPEISILQEDESPPPQPKASTSARRTKASHKAPPTWPRPRRQEIHTDDEYAEVEDEEDQLIDDEDELLKPVPAAALPNPAKTGEPKKKTASKRKPRKSEKRIAEEEKEEKKALEKSTANDSGGDLAPTMTWFEATPSASEPTDADVKQSVSAPVGLTKSGTPKKSPKKPAVPHKMVPTKLKTAIPILPDDAGGLSEGYTGTAASSPVTAQFDLGSPEPEGSENAGPLTTVPLAEEPINLENVPLPQYPLPTKPFPVQPAPKIPTGFAPVLPLDKTTKKVRHWRVARREIRGIAGGRWFAKTWVGEKESEYASNASKPGEEKLHVPRTGAASVSAPVKGKAKAKGVSSLAASAAPSRSGSSVPDVAPSNPRHPTKMRNIVTAPQSEADSDMVTPGP